MKEIEHEKHAYGVRKGKNRKTKKKTTREQEGKREGILFYKKIPRIFSARGGVGRSRRPDCNRREGREKADAMSERACVHWTSNKTNMCAG